MTSEISTRFRILLEQLEPTMSEAAARKSHTYSIEQAVRNEFPHFNRIQDIGSWTRNTAISVCSDVDYMVVLGRDDVRRGGGWVTSSATLRRLRGALEARFPSTSVWTDGPAVAVGFKGGREAVDVIPAMYEGTTPLDGYPVYRIPDGAGHWDQTTSPQRHAKYLREADAMAQGKLKGTIKLLKAWKHSRAPCIPFLGFHVELRVATADAAVGIKSYSSCMLDALRLLRTSRGRAMNDPVGISKRVPLASTEAKARAVVSAAQFSSQQALAAVAAERLGDVAEACARWNRVFNGAFPM